MQLMLVKKNKKKRKGSLRGVPLQAILWKSKNVTDQAFSGGNIPSNETASIGGNVPAE